MLLALPGPIETNTQPMEGPMDHHNEELHRVIFHGALHLCGYKDKAEADRKEMRRKEDLCLKQYFKA